MKINVSPLEPEGFALSEPERKRKDEAGAVAYLGGGSEDALDLVNGQWFWLFVVLDGYRDAGLGSRIGVEMAESDGIVQGLANDAVYLVDGSPAYRGPSLRDSGQHSGVEVLQVLGP